MLFCLALFLNTSGAIAATPDNTQSLCHSTTVKQANSQITYTTKDITAASSKIKAYYEKYNKLPGYVVINNHKVTMPQFLQLLSDDIYLHNSEGSSTVTLRNVAAPSKPVENVKYGSLTKTQYINLVKTTRSHIYSTGKAPNYENTALGKIKFQNLVYIFSKIEDFQKNKKRLPNQVSVKPFNTISPDSSVQSKIDAIGYEEARFADIQGQSSPSVMERVGYGDCWADSGLLYNKLSAAGISVRIMGCSSGRYTLHRWVAINTGNGWQTWDYRKYRSQHYGALGSGHYVVKY
ncbi:MAG: pseudomurein-binding protein [Methanobacterium sp.]|nr:pseudomurein-binding protein [Methanobacterium sp.]